MPDNKPPKILPKVRYEPPFGPQDVDAVPRDAGAGMGDYPWADLPQYNAATGMMERPPQSVPGSDAPAAPRSPFPMYNPGNYYNPLQNIQPQGMEQGGGMTAYPNPQYNPLDAAQSRAQEVAGGAPQYIQDAFAQYYQQNPNGANVTYPNRAGGQADGAIINPASRPASVPQPTGDTRQEAIQDSRSGATGAGSAEQIQQERTQDAVQKNQTLTEKAKQEGNSKELARLQAEWERIAPKAQKYNISAERLVNSYMQPGNSAAEPTLDRALGRAIADDTWAEAMTAANAWTGDQFADQKLWDEHWRAMNKGGRDPLEGHPAAIQMIQAKMQQIEQENQMEAHGQYQNWLANQS